MKITKYPDDMNPYKIAEDLARKECRVCPCCGRKQGVQELMSNNEKTIGIIHRKTINYLSFKCWSCGAQWDSEPFETGEYAGVRPFILWHILALSMYIGVDAFLYIVSKSQDIFVLMLLFFPVYILICSLTYRHIYDS